MVSLKTDNTFFGVYNRKGELEAVENSMSLALHSAAALSPNEKRVTRIVQRVLVTPLDSELSTQVALEVPVPPASEDRKQETGT